MRSCSTETMLSTIVFARAFAAGLNVRETYSWPTASPSAALVLRSHVCQRGNGSFWPVNTLLKLKFSSAKRLGRYDADVLSRRQRNSVFQSSIGMDDRKPFIARKKSGCATLISVIPAGAPCAAMNDSQWMDGVIVSNCATVIRW